MGQSKQRKSIRKYAAEDILKIAVMLYFVAVM